MSFDDLLKSLQVDYIAAIPKKAVLIRDQIKSADVPALRESFHKFKGTGRTYGLPEVSQLAETCERVCIDTPDMAVDACTHGVGILEDICVARKGGHEYALGTDPRFLEIQKLLRR